MPKIKSVFKDIMGIKMLAGFIRECGVSAASSSSYKVGLRTTRSPPCHFNRSPSGNIGLLLTIVSIPCSTTQLCVLDIETGHIFPFCDLVALYCDSQSPDQKRNHHAQTRNHPPITVSLLSNRLLPISQLNCAPFTYWSKIKAKEFI